MVDRSYQGENSGCRLLVDGGRVILFGLADRQPGSSQPENPQGGEVVIHQMLSRGLAISLLRAGDRSDMITDLRDTGDLKDHRRR